MPFVDYAFYTDEFGGAMPEAVFERVSRQAYAYVNTITFGRIASVSDAAVIDKIKRAICAVAEVYNQQEQGGVVLSAHNDGYIETYQADSTTVEQRTYNAALLYLALTGLMFSGGARRC